MIWRRTAPPTVDYDKPRGFDDFELRLGDVMRGERATLGKSLLDVQRELRIKATYIAAIENCDLTAFESQSFIAGYVRSYARYLGMDPDDSFRRFCQEANFEVAHGMSAAATPPALTAARARASAPPGSDPLANPNAIFLPRSESWLSRIEPGAIGSVAVLIALIGALGYGGWSVLREVQRVQLAPADEAPGVMAEIDPLSGMQTAPPAPSAEAGTEQLAVLDPAPQPGSTELLTRQRRPQALDVPVFVSRDGPIATIDPGQTGAYAGLGPRAITVATPQPGVQLAGGAALDPASLASEGAPADQIQVVADAGPGVELLAVRPSWVRISAADGSVLFEKILDTGERYAVPALEAPPVLRAGNSGSVYFVINGQPYGPAAPGPQVVKNVKLSEDALKEKYALANPEGDSALASVVNVADASGITRD